MIYGHQIQIAGEVDDSTKEKFLGEAAALLFPIDWPEPFGLVMIEAMACGTPVIAFRAGSVPEVIEDGVNGFIVSSEEEAIQAVKRVMTLDRRKVRQAFEKRFTARRMAEDYLHYYGQLVPHPLGIRQPLGSFNPRSRRPKNRKKLVASSLPEDHDSTTTAR